eukprot:229883-Prymnesium_polylepis.1
MRHPLPVSCTDRTRRAPTGLHRPMRRSSLVTRPAWSRCHGREDRHAFKRTPSKVIELLSTPLNETAQFRPTLCDETGICG